MPDPMALENGWLDEGQGVTSWPSLYFEDIAAFLRMKTPIELQQRLMCEYKQGKAYR